MVWRNDAHRDHVFRLHEDSIGGHCHERVEIACCQRVAEITKVVGDERMDQREVGAQSCFKQVVSTVNRNLALAFARGVSPDRLAARYRSKTN